MVFLGTVTEALGTQDGRLVRARMRIDHAYKGVSEKTLVLFDNGMCDGPDLQLGAQYLMYTRRLGKGDVLSRGCTRSRRVEDAEQDMIFLNGLGQAPPTATVFGRVVNRTDDYYGKDKPMPGALVELRGAAGTHATTTDSDGRYSFANLEPAKYTVTADLTGFNMLSLGGDGEPTAVDVQPRGCAVVNVIMRRTWRGSIAGRVIRSNGEPAPDGIDLTLIQLENRDGNERSNFLFGADVSTGERGEYSFHEVAPGRYKIVMNMYRFPSERVPYPTIYWPGARTEAGALAIEVTDGAPQQSYDFRLPPEPKKAKVTGIVLTGDGKPAQGVQVLITVLPDNDIAGDDENRPQTDADGHFSFTALEGFEYRLNAIQSGARPSHSAEVHFDFDSGQRFITLVLDRPGRFDNDPF
jgi:hypothetical protein